MILLSQTLISEGFFTTHCNDYCSLLQQPVSTDSESRLSFSWHHISTLLLQCSSSSCTTVLSPGSFLSFFFFHSSFFSAMFPYSRSNGVRFLSPQSGTDWWLLHSLSGDFSECANYSFMFALLSVEIAWMPIPLSWQWCGVPASVSVKVIINQLLKFVL